MAVNAVNSNAPTAPPVNGFANMDSSEFIRVLISELRHQDPFNPQDSAALLEQLSSLRNIESQTMLGDQLQSLVKQNQMASAGNLIGKLVQGFDTNNTEVVGLVLAVRFADDGVFLELDNGSAMNMNSLVGITSPKSPTQQQSTPPPSANSAIPSEVTVDSVVGSFGKTGKTLSGDINKDGLIDFDDLLAFMNKQN